MATSGNTYDVGDTVRVQGVFKNSSDVVVDPGTVTFKLKSPGGTVTTYVYGTDAQVVKTGTGTYYVDALPTLEGRYSYRWAGTVTNVAAGEGYFIVRESNFN